MLPAFAAKHPQIEFCVSPRPAKHPVIIGTYINGRQLEIGKETSGNWTSQFTGQDFGSGSFYLRLTKVGNVYTQSFSTDGVLFTNINASITYGDGTPTKLGFIASDDPSETSHAHIDSFTVVPEPGSFSLAAVGIIGLLSKRKRMRRTG